MSANFLAVTSSLALNFAVMASIDASLKYLWSFINMIQLIEFLLALCEPKPFNVVLLLESLSFANGDFAFLEPIQTHLTNVLGVQVSGAYLSPQDHCLEGGGFESQSFYDNSSMKLTFLLFWLMAVLPVLHFAGRSLRYCRRCQALSVRVEAITHWTSLFRIFIEFYAELGLTAFIGLTIFDFSSSSNTLDFALRYLTLAFVLAVPLCYLLRALRSSSSQTKRWQSLNELQFYTHRLLFAAILVLVPWHFSQRVYLLLALYLA